MNSEISTEVGAPARDTSFHAWHLYLLLAMAAATWAVVEARDTHPAALLLLSAAVIAAGLVGIAVHYAILGFLGGTADEPPQLDRRARRTLEQEKALVLRSIKELEFDRAMRKVSDADFAEIDGRLRARALALMAQLDIPDPEPPQVMPPAPSAHDAQCTSCGVMNDQDARFCKACGHKLS